MTIITMSERLRKAINRPAVVAAFFLFPFGAVFVIFLLIPFVSGILLSFAIYDPLHSILKVAWFNNFIEAFQDDYFLKALLNTLEYTVVVVPFGVILGLLTAILVNTDRAGADFFRAIIFVPTIVGLSSLGLVWRWLYAPQSGHLNYLLGLLGIPPHSWLKDPATAWPSIMVFSIWQSIGFRMIVFIGGLKAIPSEIYEAGIIDGTNAWQKLRHLTVPLLRNTTFFIVVISIIDSIKVFVQAYAVTYGSMTAIGGEPLQTTLTITQYIYAVSFKFLRFGYGSSMATIMFLIILVFVVLQFKLFSKETAL
jgi:multiple sugar transport system permease protein